MALGCGGSAGRDTGSSPRSCDEGFGSLTVRETGRQRWELLGGAAGEGLAQPDQQKYIGERGFVHRPLGNIGALLLKGQNFPHYFMYLFAFHSLLAVLTDT